MLPKLAKSVAAAKNNNRSTPAASSLHALPLEALQTSERNTMNRRIVPVEPASGRGELVVMEVQQEGPHELDVRLVGCEGENPYVVNRKGDPNHHGGCYADKDVVKHSQLPQLKHKFKGTNAEWDAVLAYFLLQKQLGPDQASLLEGVRMVYVLKKDHLEVAIRQDIQGIKVRQRKPGRPNLTRYRSLGVRSFCPKMKNSNSTHLSGLRHRPRLMCRHCKSWER